MYWAESKIYSLFNKMKQWFEYLHKYSILVTYFRKVKQTLTRIRKKTLEWKSLKKLGFRSDSICRIEIYLPLMFHTCAVKTAKLRISLFLLLANLCFPGAHCFGRNSLPTSCQHTKFKLSSSLQYLGF